MLPTAVMTRRQPRTPGGSGQEPHLLPIPAWATCVEPGVNPDPGADELLLCLSSPVVPPHWVAFSLTDPEVVPGPTSLASTPSIGNLNTCVVTVLCATHVISRLYLRTGGHVRIPSPRFGFTLPHHHPIYLGSRAEFFNELFCSKSEIHVLFVEYSETFQDQ